VGWKAQLKATLIKFTDDTNSHHLLQDILVTGIHNWIHGRPFPTHQYPPDWQELIDTSQSSSDDWMETTSSGEILREMAGVSRTASSNQQYTIHQL
jgi:hypothetical protein